MLRAIFIFSILIPGMALALTSRFRALMLYIWFAFFRPQEFVWIPIQSLRLSLVVGVILVVPALFTGVFPNLTHPISIGFVTFYLTGLIAQTNAVNQVIGWRYLDIHGSWTLVCLLAITIIKTPRQLMQVVAMAAGCLGFFAAKAGLASMMAGGSQFTQGLAGAYVDNNSYALVTVMTIPLLVAVAQNAQLVFGWLLPGAGIRLVKWGLYCSIPLCIYTIISTFSRSGFLAFAATGIVYLLFHPHRVRLLVALCLLGSLLYVVPLPAGYVDRIATIKRLEEDVEAPSEDVTAGRFYFWQVSLEMVRDEPLGIGMRNFGARYNLYDTDQAFGRNRDVHSSHFQVLVEQGYAAAVIWIGLFAYSFLIAFRVRKRSRTPGLSAEDAQVFQTLPLAMVVSMAGFIVGGAAVSLALNDLTWLTFALVASLDILSKKKCEEVTRNRQLAAAVGTRAAVSGPAGSLGQQGHKRFQPAFPRQR